MFTFIRSVMLSVLFSLPLLVCVVNGLRFEPTRHACYVTISLGYVSECLCIFFLSAY